MKITFNPFRAMDNDNYGLANFLICLYTFIGVVVLLFMALCTDKFIGCPNFGVITGKQTHFSFVQGQCFVKEINGNWIPRANYGAVNLEN